MLKIADKEELSQLSLTGLRSLILLELLIKEPRSLEDIRKEFIKYSIMEDSNSDDILRIDINTLKLMGCEISRADHRTNNKFVLLKHPFKINLEEDEISTLKRAYNKLKEKADVTTLIRFDNLFKKISEHVSDDKIKEQLAGISALKNYRSDIINNLKLACHKKYTVSFVYREPINKKENTKDIIADKIVLQNDKLYFYGVDKNSKQPFYFNIKRILKILSLNENNDNITANPTTVKFYIKEFGYSGLEDCEIILSGDIPEGFVVEGNYHNEFYATQRILSFGPKCKVLEPESFKNKNIEILKKMKDVYNG